MEEWGEMTMAGAWNQVYSGCPINSSYFRVWNKYIQETKREKDRKGWNDMKTKTRESDKGKTRFFFFVLHDVFSEIALVSL